MHKQISIIMMAVATILAGCDLTDDQQNEQTLDEVSYAGSYTIMNETTGTEVTVTVENGVRTIVANGLPDHDTGEFPNAGNPNSISAQDYTYTFPAQPQVAAEPTFYNIPQPFGIAINGVLIDPFAAEWYNNDPTSGWQLAALANPLGFDGNNAHVQPNGAYHYHGAPMPLFTRKDRPELIGFAGDGFPIYGPYGYKDAADPNSDIIELKSSYRLKQGERPSGPEGSYDGTYVEDYEYVEGAGDLDQCNGRTGVTPEYPDGTYYYVVTFNWPFFGRCFAGTIADSFVVELPGGATLDDRGRRRPPPPARVDLQAAARKLGVTVEALTGALGDPRRRPDLAAAADQLGVTEVELRDALGLPERQRPR